MNPAENENYPAIKPRGNVAVFSTPRQRTGTYFCAEPSVTAVVIEGLAKHKDEIMHPVSLSSQEE